MFRFNKKPRPSRTLGLSLPEVISLGKENRVPGRVPLDQGVRVAVLAVRRCAELQNAPQEYPMLLNTELIGHLRGLASRILAREDIIRLADEHQIAEITEALQTSRDTA
jgi:hypothetical protein